MRSKSEILERIRRYKEMNDVAVKEKDDYIVINRRRSNIDELHLNGDGRAPPGRG